MHFMYAPVRDVITYDYPNANNHLLNTLAMRLMTVFFPLKDHWLRVPNVLAYLVYLLFSWKIVSGFSKQVWRIGAWLLLNSIPYLLDFFSLARGYGLSIGFMMASLYYLKNYLERPQYMALFFCLAAASLAVLSNMVVLNYFLALSAVLFIHTVLTWKGNTKRIGAIVIYILLSVPLLAYSLYVSFKLRAADELFFGSRFGFWDGSVRSIITRVLYKETAEEGQKYYIYGWPYAVGSAFIILVLVASLFYFIKNWPLKTKMLTFFHSLLLIIFLCSLSVILQFYILGTPLILDRTALFLVPIFLLLLIMLFRDYLWRYDVGRIAFGVIVFASLFNFSVHANFTHCLEWKYDANTETMMHDLRNYNRAKHDNKIRSLYPHWTYHPAAAFYQSSDDYAFLRPIERLYKVDYTYDYFYLPDNEMWRMKGRPVKIIRHYPLTESTLLENLRPEKKTFYSSGRLSFVAKDSVLPNTKYAAATYANGKQCVKIEAQAFGPYFPIAVKGLPKNRPIRIEVEAEVWCTKKPMGDLAVSLHTPSDSQYSWTARQLGHTPIAPKRWTRVVFNQNLPAFITDDDRIKVYIWNTGWAPIYVSDMKAVVTDQPK